MLLDAFIASKLIYFFIAFVFPNVFLDKDVSKLMERVLQPFYCDFALGGRWVDFILTDEPFCELNVLDLIRFAHKILISKYFLFL